MISHRRTALAWTAILCLAAGAAIAAAHDDREPRLEGEDRRGSEPREERELRDSSGSGSGREDRDERDDHHDRDDRNSRDDTDGDGGRKGSGRGSDGAKERREVRGDRGEHRIDFERDPRGGERVRGEILVVGNDVDIARVRARGLVILGESRLGAFDVRVVRVRVPDDRTIDGLVEELGRALPGASVAADHVYRPSAADAPGRDARPPTATVGIANLGIVDTGIEPVTPRLRSALVATRGFAAGGYVPRAHGTAVADIAARGGATLLSADVFGLDVNDRLAATTLALVQGIDWLVESGVRVINVSIEGPDNPVVSRVIRRAIAADVIIVSAAGNGGPSATPAFPAAYPGVVAVTAIDSSGHVYRRANRGAYIAFAARGVRVRVAAPGGAFVQESGTSFAAPVVAATLAMRRSASPAEPAAEAISALARGAHDLGEPGRDDIFGWGEIIETPLTAAQR